MLLASKFPRVEVESFLSTAHLSLLGHQYTRSLHFLGAEGTFQSSAMVPWKYPLELRLEGHTHLHLFSAGGRYRQHAVF